MSNFIPTDANPAVTNYDSIGSIWAVMLNLFLGVAVAASIIGMLVSGIQLMTSKGDWKATAKAKQALTYSVTAIFLSVGAFAIKDLFVGMIGGSIDDVPGF